MVAPDDHVREQGHPLAPGPAQLALGKLHAGQRALLVLAYLPKGETSAELAAGFRIASAWGRR